jgi:hypothetical protein
MPRVILGLSTLFALAGEVLATTLHDGDVRIQSVSDSAIFGSCSFSQQSWSKGDCEYRTPERPYYGDLLPSFSDEIKYRVPENPYYGGISPNNWESISKIGNYLVTLRNENEYYSHNARKFQQRWGGSFIEPRTVFKDKDGRTDNHWDHHDYDAELDDDLADWDDGSHVSPVPEASEWALMLAGFGVIGFAANRRKRNIKRNFAA